MRLARPATSLSRTSAQMPNHTAPSPARLAANRQNALKSTGPRSSEGKARSALNALKHGLTAQVVVLPTEDAEAFEARRAAWIEEYAPDDLAQSVLVARAVHASWRLDRCARAELARLDGRLRHAADDHGRAALDRADALGERLLFEPVDQGSDSNWEDPIRRARMERRDADNPAVLARALAATAEGADWLIARWEDLLEALDTFGSWEPQEAYAACRLLGRRPEDSIDDAVVSTLIIAAHAAAKGYWSLYDAFSQARRGLIGRAVQHCRVEARSERFAPTQEGGLAWLRAAVERERARLFALKAGYLDALAARDRAGAVESAHFDDSHAAVLLRRYETANARELKQSITELARLRKDDSKRTATAIVAPQVEEAKETPSAVEEPPVVAETPSESISSSQNKPTTAVAPDRQPTPPQRERMVEMQSNGA